MEKTTGLNQRKKKRKSQEGRNTGIREEKSKMSSKKVCKKCRIFVDGDKCPVCGNSSFSDNWKGKMTIINHEKSEIAKKLEIKHDGEYTIKVR